MNIPAELRYTKDHEWAQIEGDLVCVGITDFAQSELGDIVYVDITTLDQEVAADKVFGTVDAVKAVSELFMPISGTVVAINEELNTQPDLVNQDPYGKGWMIKVRPNNMADVDTLLSADDYKALVGE
ncbi:MAG: glycine cleavage system protein GcvH [Sphingobacteriales bacterium]|nr:glycine cleavage system protein GcvH [Sphingobacteriales bacterium]